MCERLEPQTKDEDPEVTRARFDNELGVKRWLRTDTEVGKYADAAVEPGAPWWWEGDEEASASNLAANPQAQALLAQLVEMDKAQGVGR